MQSAGRWTGSHEQSQSRRGAERGERPRPNTSEKKIPANTPGLEIHMSYGAATSRSMAIRTTSGAYVTPTKAADPGKGIGGGGGDNASGSCHGTPNTMVEESFEVDDLDQDLYNPLSSETANSATKMGGPARHYYLALAQEFLAKLILEVFGATGAIWGCSEAIGLRDSSNSHFWRTAALCVGSVFFIRFIKQLRKKYREMHRGASAIPLNFDNYDLMLEKEVVNDATYQITSDSFNNNVEIANTYGI